MNKFYVAKSYTGCTPVIVEGFDEKSDAETYAALMARAKQANYIVFSTVSIAHGEPEK